MEKYISKKWLAQVTGFLRAERGGAEIWIILIMVLSIITALYSADTEIERVKQTKFEIKEHLIMSLKGATKRIDFYEASEGNIVLEGDYLEQFERYIQESLLLNASLEPLDTSDFGIVGSIKINELQLVSSGYDITSGQYFTDAGLVAVVSVPMNMKILGMDFPINLTFKPYSEIRR